MHACEREMYGSVESLGEKIKNIKNLLKVEVVIELRGVMEGLMGRRDW